MAADGSLKFDTKVDTGGFEDGVSTLDRAVKTLVKSSEAAGKRINDAFGKSIKLTELENQIAHTESQIVKLSDEMKQMGGENIPTEEYKQYSDLVSKTQVRLDKLMAQEQKMTEQSVSKRSSRWKNLQYDIDEARNTLAAYKAEMSDIESSGQAYTAGSDTSAYQKKAESLDSLNNKLYVQKQRLAELAAEEGRAAVESQRLQEIGENAEVSNQKVVKLVQKLKELKERQKVLEAAGVTTGYAEYDANQAEISRLTARVNEYRQSVEKAGNRTSAFSGLIKSAFSSATHTVTNFGKALGSGLANKAKQAVSSLRGLGKSSNNVSKSILKLSNMFKLMLIRMAMRAAIQGVKEGMQNLVQYSDRANQSMSGLMTNMTYLKNSFAAAFAPILSYVAPVLNTLINLLATAVGYINQFFSALGGGSTFVRAKKANEDYAASLKKTGGAASAAGKEAKKALAPFDDLVQIQQQGADASGGGGGGASPSDMFETVGIDKGISDFANKLKEMFTADPFVNGIKSLLGIHSPSTVLAGVGSNTVAGFNQGVTNEQAASQSVVQSWASGVASWFSNKFGISSGDSAESKKWATSIMRGFNNTVNKNYTQSQSVMETWAENVRKWFVGVDEVQGVNELSWTKFAELIIQAFNAKIDDSHTETRSPMETWAKNVKEWFWGDSDTQGTGGMYAAFYNMAKRINEGFANGISDFAYMAKDAIKRWAREAMEEAEEEFDINSPSKEFYGIAEYVVRGFNNGISAMAASSRSTVQKWLDGVMDVFDGVEVKLPISINIPNAASYLPRMASGTVVPPRAGEMSTSMRNTAGYGQEETLGYLVAKMDEMISRLQAEGNRPIQIVLNLTGNLAALARVLKPELDKEAARKGVRLVIVGGG